MKHSWPCIAPLHQPSTSTPVPPFFHPSPLYHACPYPTLTLTSLKTFPHHNRSSHADCQVLLLLRSHVPGPRHDLRPQRRQGMYVACACVRACPPLALLDSFAAVLYSWRRHILCQARRSRWRLRSLCVSPRPVRDVTAPAPRPPSRRHSTSLNRQQHRAFTLQQSSRGAELQHYVCVCEVPCRPI